MKDKMLNRIRRVHNNIDTAIRHKKYLRAAYEVRYRNNLMQVYLMKNKNIEVIE